MLMPLLECQHRSQRGTAKAEGGPRVDLEDSYLHRIECPEQPRDTETTQGEVRHSIEGRGHDGAVTHAALDDAIAKGAIAKAQPPARLIRQRRIQTNDDRALARESCDEIEDRSVASERKALGEDGRVLVAAQHDDAGAAGVRGSGKVYSNDADGRHDAPSRSGRAVANSFGLAQGIQGFLDGHEHRGFERAERTPGADGEGDRRHGYVVRRLP